MLCQPGEYDDDAIINLLGAVFRLALRDAARGVRPMPDEQDAATFLQACCPPEWGCLLAAENLTKPDILAGNANNC